MPVVFPAALAPLHSSARVVAVIPARYQSSRLPGKPLALIDGRPMIEHVYRRVLQARTIGAVLVATDDQRIAEAVDRFGGTAVMTRADHPTATDRLGEVAEYLRSDLVVNVQGDEPLIVPDAIDAAVGLLLDHPTDVMSTLRKRLDDAADLDNPHVVKVVVDRHDHAIYFSRLPLPYVRPGQATPTLWRHIGLYVYTRQFLLTLARLEETALERAEGLEQLRVLEHGFKIRTVETTADTIGVDTPDDLERVRHLVQAAAALRT